jgi:hypothetical protein
VLPARGVYRRGKNFTRRFFEEGKKNSYSHHSPPFGEPLFSVSVLGILR